MSFKPDFWLTRNRNKIALAVTVAAISVWSCSTPATTSSVPGDAALNQGKAGTGTYVQPTGDNTQPSNPGNTQTGGGVAATNPTGNAANNPPAPTPMEFVNGKLVEADKSNAAPIATKEIGKNANVPAPTMPMNAATANDAPIAFTNTAVVVAPEVVTAFPKGVATITGRIVDETGRAALGVPVATDLEKTTTNVEGYYTLKANAAANAAIHVGGNAAGYVPFNDFVGILPNETLHYDTQVLRLDKSVTKIDITKGGTAISSPISTVLNDTSVARPSGLNPKETFGLLQVSQTDLDKAGLAAVYLEIPAGGLVLPDGKTEANIRLTWLNPLPRDGKPFGDLYGPLQTYTNWDTAKQSGTRGDKAVDFLPVNFADLDLGGASVAPGAELQVKWIVGPETLAKYPITFNEGQAFMPCYQYEDSDGWTKPVLATVFQEKGYTWTRYTVRGSNSPYVVPE